MSVDRAAGATGAGFTYRAWRGPCPPEKEVAVAQQFEQRRLEQRLKALGSSTRLEIMRLLATGEASRAPYPPGSEGKEKPCSGPDEVCLCKLSIALGLAAATVSRHMAVLRDAGMVTARREGQWVHFSIHREALQDLSDQILALKALADETNPA